MAESRGRKSKKGRWHLVLGLKETLFASVGILGLMMMSFAIGTLAGRGDIYRILHNWGLLGPEATKALQPWNLPPAAGPSLPATVSAFQTTEAAPAGAAPGNPAALATQGSVTPLTPPPLPPAPSAKKTKANPAHKDRKKEEELRRLREEVAKKLKFQNSLDTAALKPKASDSKAKPGEKGPGVSALLVAKYRDKNAAKTKMAELQKQGEQATLKEGRDDKGPYFAVYRKKSATPAKTAYGGPAKPKTVTSKGKKQGE
jgi:hypothetical protein